MSAADIKRRSLAAAVPSALRPVSCGRCRPWLGCGTWSLAFRWGALTLTWTRARWIRGCYTRTKAHARTRWVAMAASSCKIVAGVHAGGLGPVHVLTCVASQPDAHMGGAPAGWPQGVSALGLERQRSLSLADVAAAVSLPNLTRLNLSDVFREREGVSCGCRGLSPTAWRRRTWPSRRAAGAWYPAATGPLSPPLCNSRARRLCRPRWQRCSGVLVWRSCCCAGRPHQQACGTATLRRSPARRRPRCAASTSAGTPASPAAACWHCAPARASRGCAVRCAGAVALCL